MPVEATPLFRPDVLRPRLRSFALPERAAEWRATLRRWAELLASPRGQAMKETELLPDFLSDVFRGILGYTAPASEGGRYTLSRETLVEVDGQFADAVLGEFRADAGAHYLAAVEGKGPGDPLERPHGGRKMSAVDQAYRYAINLPCDWIVVTNLRQVRLYHKGSTQRTYERWDVAELAENEGELRRFVFVLGAERVVPPHGRSHLYDLLESSAEAGEAVTRRFYAEYAQMRRELLAALLADNPGVAPGALLSATQKLLDRVLFIAFCEDRGLLPPETLARAYEHADPYNPRPVWENFRGLFRAIDRGSERLKIPAYNGGLFREDPVLDSLLVPDEVTRFFRRLGAYDYRAASEIAAEEGDAGQVVDVEILGHIFEQSIADLESLETELREEGAAGVAPVSQRKVTGAYYTPAFVTRYIVGEALRPVLHERFESLRRRHQAEATGTAPRALDDPSAYDGDSLNTPQRQALVHFWEGWLRELQTLRVVDPACGSGAFLIEAFDQLYAEYQAAVGHLDELERGQGRVFDPDRSILQHNLYGVDLNEEAIQIARLSIWIKTAQRGKVLTELDHNLRPGNSLVADAQADARAFHWHAAFPEVFAQGGFDVVIGNPPYVRAEQFTALKPHLQQHYETYHGAADLYVYFYELGLKLLRPGGQLSYIVTNKWLRAAYGEPLRRYYSRNARVERIIDFGHAPIFPDADVFPCIVGLRKPGAHPRRQTPEETRVCLFPREELGAIEIPRYVAEHGYAVPASRFGAEPWSLERPGVEALLEKIRRAGVPLKEFVGAAPSYGIKTGFNEAFLIDTATRDALVREDPRSAEIIRPYLRGQDLERWSPAWAGLWMIFARRGIDIDAYPAVKRYLEGYRTRLEPKPRDWEPARPGEKWPGRKAGAYEWYELQDTVDYWRLFDQPKIYYPDIAWTSQFALDEDRVVSSNSAYFIPSASRWLLAVLNSPVMWYFVWKNAVHGKDEALRLFGDLVEGLPIAPEPPASGRTVELVDAVTAIAKNRRRATRDLHDWLRVEFGVETPGQKLSAPHALDAETFIGEVKRRKSGGSSLSAAELRRLRDEYGATVRPLSEEARGAERLERELSDLVNEAYGLTPEEVALLWETAPPRMPVAPNEGRME